MEAQKAIEALGEISLVTGRQFPLKVLSYLGQKAGQVKKSAWVRLIGGRQIKQNGSCRTFGNIVVDVCQSDEIWFCKNVH